jgi:hypothetical protein
MFSYEKTDGIKIENTTKTSRSSKVLEAISRSWSGTVLEAIVSVLLMCLRSVQHLLRRSFMIQQTTKSFPHQEDEDTRYNTAELNSLLSADCSRQKKRLQT